MDRESFLREYNIDEATFESARISWEELEKSYRNYQAIEPKLRSIGKEFVDRYFYDVEKAGMTGELFWNQVWKVVRIKSMYIIKTGPVHGYLIPNRSIEGREQELVEILKKNLPESKRKGLRP